MSDGRKLAGCPALQLLNVIRVGMEIRAVIHPPKGVEDIRVNAVLDIVDRAIPEDGVDSGRMGRAKDPKGPRAATPKVALSSVIVPPGVPGRPIHVLIPSGVGKNRIVDHIHGWIIPETRVPGILMLGLDHISASVIPVTGVILRLHEFLGDHHGIGSAILHAGKSISGGSGTNDTAFGIGGVLVDPRGAAVAVVRHCTLGLQPGVERGIVINAV